MPWPRRPAVKREFVPRYFTTKPVEFTSNNNNT